MNSIENIRQSTAGMAHLCPTMSEDSGRKTQTVKDWNNLYALSVSYLGLDDWSLLLVNWPSQSMMTRFLKGVLLEQCPESKQSKRTRWKMHGLLGPSLRIHTASLLSCQNGHKSIISIGGLSNISGPCLKLPYLVS